MTEEELKRLVTLTRFDEYVTKEDSIAAGEDLARLVTLTTQFKEAVDYSPLRQDASIVAKVQAGVTFAEYSDLANLMDRTQHATKALKSIGIQPNENLLKDKLKFNEISIEFLLRAIPANQLAAYIPAELKNVEDAEALKKAGAPKLASLCI